MPVGFTNDHCYAGARLETARHFATSKHQQEHE